MTHFSNDPSITAQVANLVLQERRKSLSPREWKHRLAGYGYSLRDTAHGHIVTTLPHGIEVCTIPAEGAV